MVGNCKDVARETEGSDQAASCVLGGPYELGQQASMAWIRAAYDALAAAAVNMKW